MPSVTKPKKAIMPMIKAANAVEILAQADKKLAKLISTKEPFELKLSHMQNTFEALAESIVYQQLTGGRQHF